MKALILAGGLGTRLRPLTYTRPKHLLPIANVPHIEHVLALLRRHGVDSVVFMTSYLAEAFDEVVARARAIGVRVEVTHEDEPLGTAGAIKHAEPFVEDERVLVFNGDILTDTDLGALVGFHEDRGAEATILLAPVEDPSAFGVVPTDPTGRVLGFIEKPPPGEAPTNLINAGVYVLEPSILERIPAGEVWSAERQLFPGLVDEGARLFAAATDRYWIDIGTPDKYLRANLDELAGACRLAATASVTGDHVIAADTAELHEGARVSWSCLGAASRVGPGAVVERCVLLDAAEIGAGARVRDSILGQRARIAEGASVEGLALADEEMAG